MTTRHQSKNFFTETKTAGQGCPNSVHVLTAYTIYNYIIHQMSLKRVTSEQQQRDAFTLNCTCIKRLCVKTSRYIMHYNEKLSHHCRFSQIRLTCVQNPRGRAKDIQRSFSAYPPLHVPRMSIVCTPNEQKKKGQIQLGLEPWLSAVEPHSLPIMPLVNNRTTHMFKGCPTDIRLTHRICEDVRMQGGRTTEF